MSFWSVGCAFSLDELFENFPYKKLKITCNKCEEITNNRHRQPLVKQIFRECVKEVLNDVIDNNTTFILPLNGKVKCDIHMQKLQGEQFKALYKEGKWRDVDFLKSVFTGNQLGLFMYGDRTPRVKNIYVNRELKDKITKKTNEGFQYC